MKILHLYSDWKWTGPAEPAIQICKALEARGHDVTFACRAAPADQAETVEMKAAEYGIRFTTRFGLNRYWGLRDSLHDLVKLPAYVRRQKIEVIHTHLSHDHALGAYAANLCWPHRPVLVKSLYHREVVPATFWNNRLLKELNGHKGVVAFSDGFRREYAARFKIKPNHVGLCPMPLDLARFRPDRPFVNQRPLYGVPAEVPLIGIVARFQKYRRMDVFLQAARKVVDVMPQVRFMVIGRSSQMTETVIKPMKQLGLENHVITPGYLTDNYVDMLLSLDIFSLMTPGFDGTARALREAMALGKPCVVSNVGMLPEIVHDQKSGLVFGFVDAHDLARCWLALLKNPQRATEMGRHAALYAREHFRPEAVATVLENFYTRLRANGHSRPGFPQAMIGAWLQASTKSSPWFESAAEFLG